MYQTFTNNNDNKNHQTCFICLAFETYTHLSLLKTNNNNNNNSKYHKHAYRDAFMKTKILYTQKQFFFFFVFFLRTILFYIYNNNIFDKKITSISFLLIHILMIEIIEQKEENKHKTKHKQTNNSTL